MVRIRPELTILARPWLHAEHGTAEDRATACELRIAAGEFVITRVEDVGAGSVRDSIYVSAYPLAEWLLTNWWRLRFEPRPWGEPSESWRAAHEMSAAGRGFLWPPVVVVADGEFVEIGRTERRPGGRAPLRFLESGPARITVDAFETTVDTFVGQVIERLRNRGVNCSELSTLLRELNAERADASAALYRRYEALVGFDVDEAPNQVLDELAGLESAAGKAAVAEIAAAISGADSVERLIRIGQLVKAHGISARFADELAELDAPAIDPPWLRGGDLARAARHRLGIQEPTVPSRVLSGLLGISESVLGRTDEPRNVPIALGVLVDAPRTVSLHFRRERADARRFEAARLIGDYINEPRGESWLPVTDALTARQKVQRAFAAEFLCPLAALKDFLGQDRSDESLGDAAEYFEVSTMVVRHQLENAANRA